MWESVGATVSRLIRVRYGPVSLPRSLRPGEYIDIMGRDLEQLLDAAGRRSLTAESHLSVQRERRSRRR